MNELVIRKREVYGNVLNYPVCDKAKSLATIIGKKTISDDILNKFSLDFGYQIKIQSTKELIISKLK